MSDRKSDVFHISLTEIAFTIIMILVILLGARLHKYAQDEKSNLDMIAQQEEIIEKNKLEIEQLSDKLEVLRKEISRYRKVDDDEHIPVKLLSCVACFEQQGDLTPDEAIAATNLAVSLMKEWRNMEEKPSLVRLQKAVKDASKLLAEGKRVVSRDDYKALEATKAAQERSLKEAQAKAEYFRRRSGIDLPPCWMDDSGRSPQYLFTVLVDKNSQVHISRAWPDERNDDAALIPGVAEMLANPTMSLNEFSRRAAPILKHANARKPEACRYYVRLQNEVPDRRGADRARLKIENFFYKYEVHN